MDKWWCASLVKDRKARIENDVPYVAPDWEASA
jgi:hypothetical protein